MKPVIPTKIWAPIVAVVAALLLAGCHRQRNQAPPKPNPVAPGIILISLDTLRADRLGCYGNPRPVSPFIDSLAARSMRFSHAYSAAPRTAPSHMSIFTGLYPSEHRTRLDYGDRGQVKIQPLAPGATTLAQVLQGLGYRTAAFTGGGELAAEAGFDRGFDMYKEEGRLLTHSGLTPVKEWLTAAGSGKFFLFLHTYQIHDPYLPPPPYNKRFDPGYQGWIRDSREDLPGSGDDYSTVSADFWQMGPGNEIVASKFSPADVHHLLALYDGNIAYVDDLLKDLFAWMEQQSWWGKTVVIITSDHGEEFKEHGFFLHRKLYVETTHVPLIIHFPADAGAGVIEKPFGLVGLADLILNPPRGDRMMTFWNEKFVGARKPSASPTPQALSEEPWLHGSPHRSIRDGRFCLYLKGDRKVDVELYDVIADPGELNNLAAERPREVARLKAALASAFPPPPRAPEPPRSLGQPGLRDNGKPQPALGRTVPERPGVVVGENTPNQPAEPGPARSVPANDERKKKLRALGYIQ